MINIREKIGGSQFVRVSLPASPPTRGPPRPGAAIDHPDSSPLFTRPISQYSPEYAAGGDL